MMEIEAAHYFVADLLLQNRITVGDVKIAILSEIKFGIILIMRCDKCKTDRKTRSISFIISTISRNPAVTIRQALINVQTPITNIEAPQTIDRQHSAYVMPYGNRWPAVSYGNLQLYHPNNIQFYHFPIPKYAKIQTACVEGVAI